MDSHLRGLIGILIDPAFETEENAAQKATIRALLAACEAAESQIAHEQRVADDAWRKVTAAKIEMEALRLERDNLAQRIEVLTKERDDAVARRNFILAGVDAIGEALERRKSLKERAAMRRDKAP